MFYITNHLSVWVAALTTFFLGWIWYGPLFGKQWMAMMGITKDSIKSMKMKPTTAMAWGFVSMLVMAYVVSMIANSIGVVGFSGAVNLTFLIWFGFIATTLLGSVLWENRSINLYLFNIVYQFISLLLMTLIITMWR